MKATPLDVELRHFTCRYDGSERFVRVNVMDPTAMMESLFVESCQAFNLDTSKVIGSQCKWIIGTGAVVVAEPSTTHKRFRLIQDVADGATMLFVPAIQSALPPPPTAAVDATTAEHVLRCCSMTLTERPIRQPRFEYTLFREEEGDDADIFPVCGPCAHTCHNMQHVHIMDSVKVLNRPFSCACASIRADGHECYWSHDPARGRVDKAVVDDGVTRWDYERRAIVGEIRPIVEKEAAVRNAEELEGLTQRLKSSMDSFEQYYDADAQAEARAVVPLVALNARAEAAVDAAARSVEGTHDADETPLNIHDALLIELAQWFFNDFFSWVTRPDCEICGAESRAPIDPNRRAVPTQEERLNWAYSVELYECPHCNVDVRFPRYQKARRLLTYRKGRCGEFASCFTLIAMSLGYECRLVSSLSDQAWLEVYSMSKKRWLHVDPSYGVVDTPLMYEAKAASQPPSKRKIHHYVFSYSVHQVVDVTRRYNSAPNTLKRDKVTEVSLARLVHGMSRIGMQRLQADALPFWEQRNREEGRELSLAERRSDVSAFKSVDVVDDCDGDINLINFPGEKAVVEINDATVNTESIEFPASVRDGVPSLVASVKNRYGNGARLPVPARPTSSVADVSNLELTFTAVAAASGEGPWIQVAIGDAFSVRVTFATASIAFKSATPLLNSQCTKTGGSAPVVPCNAVEAFSEQGNVASAFGSAAPPSQADVTVLIDSMGAVSFSAVFTAKGGKDSAASVRKGIRRGALIPAHAWASYARGVSVVSGADCTLTALRATWD